MTEENKTQTTEDFMKKFPKNYESATAEPQAYQKWLDSKAFHATPDDRDDRYVVMMPLPNITGALHMGHAMDNVMQDMLIRWHRMMGDNTLWMPGTDHAGIATQAVVEKRLLELEGKTRHDIGREGLVTRIMEWKDEYQTRIIKQQQRMGCSCDWERQRFTMDKVCSRAVRETFFKLFEDGLIFRGNRLVNWDNHLQTAVADDEIYYETVPGHFWHIRYPVIDPKPGEPEYIVIATTRPETLLGDTGVAISPNPRTKLEDVLNTAKKKLETVSEKEKPDVEAEIERIEARIKDVLPFLEKLVEMANDGRKLMLPLQNREIPLIADIWAKPEMGTGAVKVTPAHDNNDYGVWQRNEDKLDIINILNTDGTLNENAGTYQGMSMKEARKAVLADLEKEGLMDMIEDREVEIGHSDRSKTPIEPFLSKQWFVRMGDVEDGITLARGTNKEFKSSGLAQAAMDAVKGDWKSATGRKLTFHPDPVRYGNTYYNWLAEKRDWCISRQLWWGHRIPIWHKLYDSKQELLDAIECLPTTDENLCIRVSAFEGYTVYTAEQFATLEHNGPFELQVCIRGEEAQKHLTEPVEAAGLVQDPDVLDTWFSSALWPHSTLGWPNPANAPVEAGQAPLGSQNGNKDCVDYYYPGSCLVTGRDIITLWVARMVITGLYNLGDLPFTDCFLHANIQDGKGERMSKSKGNGIDPIDIIDTYGADAMRYVICDMQTGNQDIRLPAQAISPFTGKPVELATAKHGRTIFTYLCPETGKEFDVLGTIPELPNAKIISDRFDVGRNFCNKLWNAVRFVLINMDNYEFKPITKDQLKKEDEWVIAKLSQAIDATTTALKNYSPSVAISAIREFFWTDFCDWYIEIVKPRLAQKNEEAHVASTVLTFALDQILRMLHPFTPFVTESLWEKLSDVAPTRGLFEEASCDAILMNAAWPTFAFENEDKNLMDDFDKFQKIISGIRDIRARYDLGRAQTLDVAIKAEGDSKTRLESYVDAMKHIAGLETVVISESLESDSLSASLFVSDVEVQVKGVVDPNKEIEKLEKQKKKLMGGLIGAEKKLANPKFVENAPPQQVELAKEKLAEYQGQVKAIDESLEQLKSLT
jgi:valyl-tRNA synthetase